jgi:type I restriction enzyme S subunit
MSEWKTYKLGDLVTFQRGHDLTKSQMQEGIFPVAGSNGVIGFHNEYTTKAPSITIGRSGNIGNAYFFDKDFWAHNTTLYIKEFKNCDPKFIYYLLQTMNFGGHNSGSAVPSLNRNYIHPIEVQAPDLPTQKEIAQILSSLDDKIELNLQMNQTLEAMAQAIFKEWFVDFNFPGFDGELVDGLPKGWRIGKLGEVCEVQIGRTPPRMQTQWFSLDKNDVKWISIKDMGQSGVYIFSTSEYLTNEAIEKFRIPVIEKNTVIVSFKLTVGRLAITTEKMLSNEAIAQLKTEIIPEFLFLYLKNYNWGALGSTSSIATAVNSKSIKEIEILVADEVVLKEFEKVISPIFEKIKNNSIQIQTLTQTRDALLPKLMSGELEIKN